VEGIAKARRWVDELVAGRVTDTAQIAQREGRSERSVRMTLNLAFLSPEIVKAAVEGTLPSIAGISRLIDAPVSWSAQMSLFDSGPIIGTAE
jgi:site-specific DNA recombinase